MARWWRWYEKKRGHRRTGSPVLGMLGELLFHGAVFFLGCLGFALILVGVVIPDWRANRDFLQTECTVLEASVVCKRENGRQIYRPAIRIRYEVAGETYVTTLYPSGKMLSEDVKQGQGGIRQYVVGQKYPCWYDPANPEVVVFERRYHWGWWLLMVVPAALIGVGAGGLIYGLLQWGTSAERRAVLRQQAKPLSLADPDTQQALEWPGIPSFASVNESPGTTLAYRLPMVSERGWALGVCFVVCVVWNSIVLIFFILMVSRSWQTEPGWVGPAFLGPFALVGAGTIYWFFREWMLLTFIGPTIVELSDHPLQAGQTYELFLSQAGRLRMQFLELLLVCEEETIYRQGTTVRREVQRVYQEQLFGQEDFTISGAKPFELRCKLSVPAAAMHSFHSPHNKIEWKIILRGKAHGWPPFQRAFPFVLLPAEAEAQVPCPSNPILPSA